MNKRKKYVKHIGQYFIVATQLTSFAEEYSLCIKEFSMTRERTLIGEWIRPKTSPFMDGIKKEMCFFVQAPIDDTIPLSEFEMFEF